jgi:hypothetical protein
MASTAPKVTPDGGVEPTPERQRVAGEEPKPEIWRGTCLERFCGPEPSREQIANWFRYCQYHCADHSLCKQTDPPGPL